MNHLVPDWNTEGTCRPFHDVFTTNQKKSGPGNDLVELLWRNGHVVMQSQTHRKPIASEIELRESPRTEQAPKCQRTSAIPIQEHENSPWFRYPIEDSIERELFGDIFCDDNSANNKPSKHGEGNSIILEPTSRNSGLCIQNNGIPDPPTEVSKDFLFLQGNGIPPSKLRTVCSVSSLTSENLLNLAKFPRPRKAESSSMRRLGSSLCSNDQEQNLIELSQTLSNDVKAVKETPCMSHTRIRTNTCEPTIASSSGISGSSFRKTGNQSTSNQGRKRKGRDGEECEYQSEDADFESIDAEKPEKRSSSTRRTRAAEVHNLSERRRRDRINEKMKALQELIPHCNKSDKASMLDEAIEYLKSLQLQVQIMWMGSGMAQMMFPGIQQYISRMSMGMAPTTMPSIHHAVQLPNSPIVSQSLPGQSPNSVNMPNQLRNICLPESYAQYLGFQNMQTPPQAMNLYAYGTHMAQQNQPSAVAGTGSPFTSAGVPSENIQKNQLA